MHGVLYKREYQYNFHFESYVAAGLLFWSAGNTPVIILPTWLAMGIFLVSGVLFIGVIALAIIAIARA